MYPDRSNGQTNFKHNESYSRYCATHADLSINRTRKEIFNVAKEQQWRVLELPRGGFNVIE